MLHRDFTVKQRETSTKNPNPIRNPIWVDKKSKTQVAETDFMNWVFGFGSELYRNCMNREKDGSFEGVIGPLTQSFEVLIGLAAGK